MTVNYIIHCIALNYITLHCTLYCITLITLYIALNYYITLYIALHYIILRIKLHYTLHCIKWHYIIHCIKLHYIIMAQSIIWFYKKWFKIAYGFNFLSLACFSKVFTGIWVINYNILDQTDHAVNLHYFNVA